MTFAILLLTAVILPTLSFAQSADIYAAIRKEGMENSKIMNTMHYFTDLYGPRLTGSPNHKNAAQWAANEMKAWGFDNTLLEPWDFGHPGWVNDRNTGVMLTPVADTLTFEVLAWTPSTKAKATADVVNFVIPQFPAQENPRVMQNPTQAELTQYLNQMASSVKGKIVLMGKPTFVDQTTAQTPKRIADDVIKCRMDPMKTPADCGPGGPGGGPQRITPTTERVDSRSGSRPSGQVFPRQQSARPDQRIAARPWRGSCFQ